MKKVLLLLVSVMAIALTGCKNEATISVSVKDNDGAPVADRYVFFTSKVAAIADLVLPPTPDELVSGDSGTWSYILTNRSGVAETTFDMGVSKAKYIFCVFDQGTSDHWKSQEVELRKGTNDPIEFKVIR